VRIDTRKAAVDRRYALQGCVKPVGLALNGGAHLAYVACGNGRLVVVDTTGRRADSVAVIGPSADSVVFDLSRARLVVACDRELDVMPVGAGGLPGMVTRVPDGPGARVAAEDAITGALYVVAPGGVVPRALP
jgi:hypothetical protein